MQVYGVADMSAQVEIDFFKNCYKKKVYMQVQSDRCKDAGGDQLVQGTYSFKSFSKFSLWAAGRR